MMTKKAEQATEQTGVAVIQSQNGVAINQDFMDYANMGMETADKDSFAIPFLRVIQKMSPEVDESDAKYMENAKPGMLLNTVTRELYDGKKGVVILPVVFQRRFIHWGARGSENAGFQGEHSPTDAEMMSAQGIVKNVEGSNRLYYPLADGSIHEKKSDTLDDTRNHYVLMLDESGGVHEMLLSLGSTQIKKSKQLLTMLGSIKVKMGNEMKTPPTWCNRIRVQTVVESNAEGSWHGVQFSRDADAMVTDPALFGLGVQLYKAITGGEKGARYDEPEGEATAASDKF